MKNFLYGVFPIFVPMIRQLTLLAAGALLMSFNADKPAYRIYNSGGKEVSFSKMMKSLYEADVILFGESHDNPIAHWLELEVTEDLYSEVRDALILGAEMFEADNQLLLDEFLSGTIPVEKFEDSVKQSSRNILRDSLAGLWGIQYRISLL